MAAHAAAGVNDMPFVQEYHEAYPVGDEAGANDVRSVAVDPSGNVWAATAAGAYVMKAGTTAWVAQMSEADAGPAFDVVIDGKGVAFVGAWNGICHATAEGLARLEGTAEPIAALWVDADGKVSGIGPDCNDDEVWKGDVAPSRNIRAALADPKGGVWLATGTSLFHHSESGDTLYRAEEDLLSCDVYDVAFAPDGSLWIASLGGITVRKAGRRVGHFMPEDGLPSVRVQCVACGPDGRMWVGTERGVTRFDGQSWSLRHSRRWLLDDDVRDVAFGPDGTAWMATAAGVSAIKQRKMTLAEKAAYFERVTRERHIREPFIVEKCRLPVPGDTRRWEPEDDDNDGSYTAQYMVAECFRYAVTKDDEAKANAKKALDFLLLLQTVTETPGFIARTVVPSDWDHMHDPGDQFDEKEWAERKARDPRHKRVAKRWLPSRDGKWLWKRDTSSDEITGHFFGYHYYYDLAADDTEKARLRDHVRRAMDHIIDGGYVLVDIDGTHTRWGVWSPEKLNHDPDWAPERGINSLEILSFLKTTYHITGDEKYQQEFLGLLNDHGYADNVRRAKTYQPAWSTHIDTELLAMAYPALFKYEVDPELRALFRDSFDTWYRGARNDGSPYFNFTYAACTGEEPDLVDSLAFLRASPLDLVNWRVDNTRREDVRLVRSPILEAIQTDRLLPADERAIMRWDKNPYEAVLGDGGHTEWAPTFWLLAYWMGRYHGYLE